MPLRISDRNKMVLWPGCEGRTEFSLHTKNVRSVWFIVKRRGCCCNLSSGVALIVWFTTNGMCVKNSTIICVARASNSKRDCEHDLYCCLLPRCEALRACRSGFPIATVLCKVKREMQALACCKPPALETCSDSVWYFIGFNAEYLQYIGACHDSQTDTLDVPLMQEKNSCNVCTLHISAKFPCDARKSPMLDWKNVGGCELTFHAVEASIMPMWWNI